MLVCLGIIGHVLCQCPVLALFFIRLWGRSGWGPGVILWGLVFAFIYV